MTSRGSVVVDLKFDRASVASALKGAFADREVINLAEPENRNRNLSSAHYAVIWKPDEDLFRRASGLKVLFSGGAGVDHVLKTPNLPSLPIVRFVDESLTVRMSEWVVLQCLFHLRQMPQYARQQSRKLWHELPQPEARQITVGIMGMGILGQDAAAKLKVIGFDVIGWSRTEKRLEGIETFSAGEIDTFLSRTDFLVGLLPLTAETKGIYNAALFSKLRQGGALGKPVFINAGRGGSQVEADIAAALENGTLGGASLDVFETEPLPADHPLWAMDNVVITPHAAASSDAAALFRHAETQIARFERQEPLQFLVSRESGY